MGNFPPLVFGTALEAFQLLAKEIQRDIGCGPVEAFTRARRSHPALFAKVEEEEDAAATGGEGRGTRPGDLLLRRGAARRRSGT